MTQRDNENKTQKLLDRGYYTEPTDAFRAGAVVETM